MSGEGQAYDNDHDRIGPRAPIYSAPMTDPSSTGRPPETVRLGVLGLGAVAQAVHLPLLDRLAGHYAIAAIADLSPSLGAVLGDRYRVPAARRHRSLDDLLDGGDLDALLVLTSGSHGAAVLEGLDRGLPVFAEKPLAYTLAEADAIARRLEADRRRRLQVGYMKLYDPAVTRALALAGDGSLGRPRSVEVTVLHPSSERQLAHARLEPPPRDVDPAVLTGLRAEAETLLLTALGEAAAAALGPLYANVLLGSVVHELALVRAFSGDPVAIDAVDVWPADRWPPSVGITARLPDDARLSIRWHFLPDYAAYREEVRVVYETATIELAFPAPYLLHRPTALRVVQLDDRGRGEQGRRDTVWTSTVEAFEEELLAFHALVAEGRRPAAGVVEGRADIVTCQRIAARLAVRSGLAIGGEAAT
jgi:myo-inositol 2-dehydrogenase / D-chiro-inositol 1-dehydrogenase